MKNRIFLFILLLIISIGIGATQEKNLLYNGSFELGAKNKIPIGWGKEYYNCYVLPGGPSGKNYLKIINKTSKDSLGAQVIPLDQKMIKRIGISAYIKADQIVSGKEGWQKGNIQILFFDKTGKQLSGWPEVGPFSGTFGWKLVKKAFVVPKGTVKAKVVLGLIGCKGSISFDDVRVVAKPKNVDPYNLISSGDFDVWEDWAYGGSNDWGIVSPGYRGEGALRIHNDIPQWSFASQSVPLDGRFIKKIKIEGYAKIENVVQGSKPWQQARINIEFKDYKGLRIDGWPIVESWTGTFPWKKVGGTFDVPPEVRRVDVFCGILETTGTAYFDELKLIAYDKDGKRIMIPEEVRTDTTNWFRFAPLVDDFKLTPIDVSFLLDPPAGKHGFMKVKDGHFYFEDGMRIRFWGTNIYGSDLFMNKEKAARTAKKLAKYGCNLVRIHHLDAFWADPNIFDKKYNDTQHLSSSSLDKLDYLIYQLKKHGIYIFMDLLVDREFKEGDGVPDYKNVERGAKITGFFNKRIINLQKKYAHDLLLHYNPYTGLRYIDDPAIVSVKLINEATLFYIGTQFGLSKVYLSELDSLFNKWLLQKYGSRTNLEAAWTDRYGRRDLEEGENPEKGTVRRADIPLKFQRGGYEKLEPLRQRDTMNFYYDLQNKYFSDMKSYLQSLGLKVPISGSNHWVNIAADVASNLTLDYIDRHRYWDHPQFGYGTQIVFEDQPMVKYPDLALPNNFAFYKVASKPFVISEWNNCFPNEYRVEGPLIMAAYANLQDFDGVLQFSFNSESFKAPMTDNFDISAWPNVLGQWPAAALLFYRGDVKQSENVLEETLSDKDIFGPIYEDEPIADDPYLPLITKTQRKFVKTPAEVKPLDASIISKFHNKTKKIIVSEGGELTWDYGKGIFKIETLRTQGAVGFMKGEVITLPDLTLKPNTKFSSIVLSSLSPKPISTSAHLLLTAGAQIENSNQVYNGSKTQLRDFGDAPILVEGVNSKIKIKTAYKRATIYSLDINGKKKELIPTVRIGDGFEFDIKGSDRAFFYEIVLK